MKLLWLIGILAFAALGTRAYAPSTAIEILPGQPQNSPGFNITSERLPSGEVQFTVEIKLKSSFSLEDYRTSLGIANITKRPNGWSTSCRHLRTLTGEQSGDVIKCVFSVTQKELEDPDFSFIFFKVRRVEPVIPGFVFQFARLKNFVKP